MVANPVNAGKGLMQRVEAMIRAALPRQAIVTRNDGSGVFVRFVGEDAGNPESRFPSTIAGVPAGTVGWVATLAGGKGLFHATGIQRRMPQRTNGVGIPGGNTVSTAGTYLMNNSLLTWTGLIPSRTYWVEWTITVGTSGVGTNPRGYFGAQVSHSGGNSTYEPADYHSQAPASAINRHVVSYTDARELQPDSDGEIRIVPTFRWLTDQHTIITCTIVASVE